MKIIGSTSGKISYKMSSEVTNKNKMSVEDGGNGVKLKCDTPRRPQRLRLKTEKYYDVKLPTYEESQNKYAKFMKTLPDVE